MNVIEQTVKSIFGPMQFRCPSCDAAMDMSNVNVREEVALCPVCGKLSKPTEVTRTDHSMQELLAREPAGCSVARDGERINVSVSLRSIPKFITLLFELLFWNGLLSFFLAGLFAAYYNILVGPLPAWFPFTKNGVVIINDSPAGLNETLLATLIITPLTIIGFRMLFQGLIRLAGKTSIVISENAGYLATGVGPLRWRRNFDMRQVNSVETIDSFWTSSKLVRLSANRTIRFGVYLDHEQMLWAVGVLKVLLQPQSNRSTSLAITDRWLALQEAQSGSANPPKSRDAILAAPQVHCPGCSQAIDPESINIEQGLALCNACGGLSHLKQLSSESSSNRVLTACCPDCAINLETSSINVKEGVALCPACGTLSQLWETTEGGPSAGDLIADPPENCSVVPTAQGVEVRISSRSIPMFVMLLVFSIFWNGLVSVLIAPSATKLHEEYIGPPPAWLLDLKNMTSEPSNTPMFDFLCLTPFALIGIGVILMAFMLLFGRQSIVVDERGSYHLEGFRHLNWKRRFDRHQVRSIEIVNTQWSTEDGNNRQIKLQADRTIKFGAFLPYERQRWMVAVLKVLLLPTTSQTQPPLADRISALQNRQESI